MNREETLQHLLDVSRQMAADKSWTVTEDELVKYHRSSYEFGFACGALWQKEQDQETIELAEDHAMLAGMNKMKEQMMAKAIDATIGSFTNGTIYDADFDINSNLKDNDKVKVIVIKDDKDE